MRRDPASLRLAVLLLNHARATGRQLTLVVGQYRMFCDPESAEGRAVRVVRRRASLDAVGLEDMIDVHADIAIEAVGPYDRYVDISERVLDHLDAGARSVVLIDAAHRLVTVHAIGFRSQEFGIDATLASDDLMADFECPVADLLS